MIYKISGLSPPVSFEWSKNKTMWPQIRTSNESSYSVLRGLLSATGADLSIGRPHADLPKEPSEAYREEETTATMAAWSLALPM